MKKIIIVLLAAIFLTGCGKEDGVSDYLKEEAELMTQMTEAMGAVESTGSVELDFLYGMIPHHESAVEMS